jgi:hypothetical protein
MKIAIFDGVVELEPSGEGWSILRQQIEDAGADIVLANEMPFGEWLASSEKFDAKRAENNIRLHDEGLDALPISMLGSCFRHNPFAQMESLPTKRSRFIRESTVSCIKSTTFPKSQRFTKNLGSKPRARALKCFVSTILA